MPAGSQVREAERVRFERLYRDQWLPVYRFVLRRIPEGRSTHDAADLAAEVFSVAWRRICDVPSPPADRLWLYGTAKHVVARHLRATTRRRRLGERLRHETDRSVPPEDPDLPHAVRQVIRRLSDADREVIYLVMWEGLTPAQAAVVLGCSANAASVRLHRAQGRLRSRLEALGLLVPGVEPKAADREGSNDRS